MLRYSEQFFNRLPWPIYGRIALAGLAVGALAIEFPFVWGNGYGAINQILKEPPRASGSVVFARSIPGQIAGYAGHRRFRHGRRGVHSHALSRAGLGSLFGATLHAAGWTTMPTGAFALVGMGSVLAATIHAPVAGHDHDLRDFPSTIP